MMPAAKAFDPIVGIDIHFVQPPGTVPPVPVPHPFIGLTIDPIDFVPVIGATVLVNGMPRATAGTGGMAIPPHIPMGGAFVKPPGNEGEVFMGSSTVVFDGEPAGVLAMPVLSCQDVGMPPPLRPRKRRRTRSLVLPTSVVLPVPMGAPVLIGGPPTISLVALGMRAGMAALGKGLKALKRSKAVTKGMKRFRKARQKAFANMKPGFVKCNVLRAEPVNIVTGDVVVEQLDFHLPWRIPLRWIRRYGSHNQRAGVCGHGWETPADARLEVDSDGIVSFHDGTSGAAVFPTLPADEPVMELVDGATLERGDGGALLVRTKRGLIYNFPPPPAGEAEALVSSVADRSGNWIEFVRAGRSLCEIRESSGVRLVVRSDRSRITGIDLLHPLDEGPRPLVRYSYVDEDLAVARDALGSPYHFTYDDHRLVRHTDRNGLSFHYTYEPFDGGRRCVHAWGDGGLYDCHFEYGPGWTRTTDPAGGVWLTEHADGLPSREVSPLGTATTYKYDGSGRTCRVTDPLGHSTEWRYDDAGNQLVLTRPDGSTLVAEYNTDHRAVALTEPTGAVLRFEYDRGRLTARTAPRGGRWTYEYNGTGDLVAATDPGGGGQRFQRDRFGNVIALGDRSGTSASFERDGLGNITARRTEADRTEYRYDPKGRLVRALLGNGSSIHCVYDAADNLIEYTDENGATIRLAYFGLGELAERVGADGQRVRYRYDAQERLASVINERGEEYRIERDPLGRVLRETDYWGQAREYEYDDADRLVAMMNPLGERVELVRDPLDRLIQRRLPGGQVESFSYDAADNIVAATGPGGRVERVFDQDGNRIREVGDGIVVQSEYDLAGRRTGRSTSLGNALQIAYDGADQATEIVLNGRPLARMEYDAGGRLVRERVGSRLEREYAYDNAGRLAGQRLRRGGVEVAGCTCRYDAGGRLIERTDLGGDVATFAYDPAGRVRHLASPAVGSQRLFYDAAGDLLKQTGGPDGRRTARAASWAGTTHHYDAAGRLVRRDSDRGSATFAWDAADRLVSCTNEEGQRIEFRYDPLGRRTAKTVDGQAVLFAWDGDHLLADMPAGKHAREFVFRPRTFAPIASTNGAIQYYETDAPGIPRAVFDEAGDLLWRGEYDALARLATHAGSEHQPLRLQGQYHDVETGLSYNRHRYYDDRNGSFISQDPLRQRAGSNLYAYGPSVWNWVDVFGLECKTVKVYRVEGPGNAKVHVDGDGNISIPNKTRMLHISFRERAHADYFLAKGHAKGLDSVIKSFEVPEDVVADIQRQAVRQRDGKKFPGAPQIDDPKVSKELGMAERDVLGVRGEHLEALEQNAIPGSAKIHR